MERAQTERKHTIGRLGYTTRELGVSTNKATRTWIPRPQEMQGIVHASPVGCWALLFSKRLAPWTSHAARKPQSDIRHGEESALRSISAGQNGRPDIVYEGIARLVSHSPWVGATLDSQTGETDRRQLLFYSATIDTHILLTTIAIHESCSESMAFAIDSTCLSMNVDG